MTQTSPHSHTLTAPLRMKRELACGHRFERWPHTHHSSLRTRLHLSTAVMSHELALALLTTSASLGLAAAVPAATAASLGLVDADATPLPLARNLSSAGGGGGARPWGPPDLEQVCVDGICHRFGRLRAPLDHDDPAQGDWDLTYFVNSNFWDPIAHPHAPVSRLIKIVGTGRGGQGKIDFQRTYI